jgi:hypothetical protein
MRAWEGRQHQPAVVAHAQVSVRVTHVSSCEPRVAEFIQGGKD